MILISANPFQLSLRIIRNFKSKILNSIFIIKNAANMMMMIIIIIIEIDEL